MGFNYATLYNLYHFGGYEPLVLRKNAEICLNLNSTASFDLVENIPYEEQIKLLNYLRLWGVRWYIVEKNTCYPFLDKLALRYRDDKRNVFYDSLAKPLVSWKKNNSRDNTIHYKFHTNYIDIKSLNDSNNFMNINVVFNAYFKVYIDGHEAPLYESQNSQLELFVPEGPHSIKIEYSDPYYTCGVWGMNAFLIIALTSLFLRRTVFFPGNKFGKG